jgi:hypothetical protein
VTKASEVVTLGYSVYSGWGDGSVNLVALRAAVRLFKDPVPPGVKITLERDGQAITTSALDASAIQDVLGLSMDADATGSVGPHTGTLRAEPAVPGLGNKVASVQDRAAEEPQGRPPVRGEAHRGDAGRNPHEPRAVPSRRSPGRSTDWLVPLRRSSGQ